MKSFNVRFGVASLSFAGLAVFVAACGAAGSSESSDGSESAVEATSTSASESLTVSNCLSGALPRVNATASSTIIIPSGHSSGGPPTNAIDSHKDSLWYSDITGPQWLQIDLGVPRTVNRLTLSPGPVQPLEVQGSTDGVNYTTWKQVPAVPSGADIDVTGFEMRVRYVRIYSSTGSVSIDEAGVFGDANPRCASLAPATVTRDCGFAGTSTQLGFGRYDLSQLLSLGVFNDDISAVRVAEGYGVTLYQDAGFGGFQVSLATDQSCLVGLTAGRSDARTWNDDVSSIEVKPVGDNSGALQVFSDANFAGNSQRFGEGIFDANSGELARVGNDAISSLQVAPGYRVIVCSGDSFNAANLGTCRLFSEGDHAFVGADLNDQISLVAVATTPTPSAGNPLFAAADANLAGSFQYFGRALYEAESGNLNIVGNDTISSLSIDGALQAIVCADDGFNHTNVGSLGLCRLYGTGTQNFVGADLNDKISLILVGR